MLADHPGDHFHKTTSGEPPYFSQTVWYTLAIPERRLTAQLYGQFFPNLGVCAAAAYVWDDSGDTLSTCRYAKNFWHLPLPEADLTNVELANGARYRCLEPGMRYALGYRDPDHGEVEMDLSFHGICEPNMLGDAHFDQPGRVAGTLRLGDETIEVDGFGMRDGSWHERSPFGGGLQADSRGSHGGYTWGCTSQGDAFHLISREDESGRMPGLAGFVLRAGRLAGLRSGEREVLERSGDHPALLRLTLVDELDRESALEGRCVNALGMHRSPNAWTWNCLTEWRWDGEVAWGEDHDNWSTAGVRRFRRGEL